jgi:hypothetical protein
MTVIVQPLIAKELRALFPVWGACATALILAGVPGDPKLYSMALLVYVIGAIALGAVGVGHEYTGRTLGLLLSHPIDRGRLLLIKTAALGLMLIALAAVAWICVFNGRAFHLGFTRLEHVAPHATAVLLLPALAGLCIAPVLTMLCRSPMAGIVFTATAMGGIWGTAQGFVLFEDGQLRSEGSSLDVLALAPLWYGTIGLAALGAIAAWRTFIRLEAVEGRGQDLHVPQWFGATARPAARATTSRWQPVWHLALKELHLQQMTFVVAALYVLCWSGISALRPLMPEDIARQLDGLAFLYPPLIALLAGSLASAEERQFGTLEWQVLLPLAAWRQWVVKAGTAIGLAFLLGLALPALLETIRPSGIEMQGAVRSVGALMLVLVSVGIYVSSLSTTGVRAMLLSLPVAMLVFVGAAVPFSRPGYRLMEKMSPSVDWLPFDPAVTHEFFLRNLRVFWAWELFAFAVPVLFAIFVVRFALVNHRSLERSRRQVCKHAVTVAGAVWLGMFLMFSYNQMGLTIIHREFAASKAARTARPPAAPSAQPAPEPTRQPAPGTTKPAPPQ